MVFVLLVGCAQIVPLTGGKKDINPPELLGTNPPDRSVNIPLKNFSITFKFDEIIDAKTAQSSLSINPVPPSRPSASSYGKKLTITFNEDLDSNTTYQIQVNDAVADIHEGNKYKRLSYIFSTGPTIDSSQLQGKVAWALNNVPVQDVSVLLYTNLSDTAPVKTKPYYMTKTDAEGLYSFNALKPGVYQVLALLDKNKSITLDEGEPLAFLDSALYISDSITVDFLLSSPKPSGFFIKKKIQAFSGYHKYILNDTFPGVYIVDYDSLLYETRNDTLEVYYKNIFNRNISFVVKEEQQIADTISIETDPEEKTDSSIAKGTKKINVSFSKKTYGSKNDDVGLTFSFPITKIDENNCHLIHDSVTEKPLFTNEMKNEDGRLVTTYLPSYKRRLLNTLKENTSYTLLFLPGSITTYWNTTNKDTVKIKCSTFSNDDIGSIQVKLIPPDSISYYILQVLNDKGKVLEEYASVKKGENLISFYNMAAADYNLRLINDKDSNRKYTPANYTQHLQPEKVYQYDKTIKVPAGWDVELSWDFLSADKK